MTQITDEMVEAATKAADEAKKEFQFANTTIPALTAAYPLIRKQVLEEAAKVCDALDEWEVSCGIDISNACAQAIRGMKEDK